jgi:hypothetical protein
MIDHGQIYVVPDNSDGDDHARRATVPDGVMESLLRDPIQTQLDIIIKVVG